MNLVTFIVVFLVLFAIILVVVGLGLRYFEAERKKKVSQILSATSDQPVQPEANLLTGDKSAPLLALSELPLMKGLAVKIQQAGLTWSPLGLLAAMAVGAVVGFFVGSFVRVSVLREAAAIGFALLFGSLPYLYMMRIRRKRMNAFEEQFPEALDFLARSMRAGHAFSVSLEMMSDESPEPLGPEFRRVFHEQNLGSPLDVALRSLAERVPILDVRFFVAAVLLQRETGGNLAEILTKLAFVIRERFRLKGQVKAASAHGRLTAMILTFMPIVTLLALMFVAPGYIESMAADKDGKFLIVGAIVGQVIGYIWMKKIINIKV